MGAGVDLNWIVKLRVWVLGRRFRTIHFLSFDDANSSDSATGVRIGARVTNPYVVDHFHAVDNFSENGVARDGETGAVL